VNYINAERRRQLQSPLCRDGSLGDRGLTSGDISLSDRSGSNAVGLCISSVEFFRMPRLTDLSANMG
jgi:hypothetical protein